MDITAKIVKRKTGKAKGKWAARVSYFDQAAGRMRTIEKARDKRSDAIDERNRLVNDLKKSHGGIREGERMTFTRLAEICSRQFYKPAVIENGLKTEGVRSYAGIQSAITNLTQFFGKRRIGEITTESLFDYREWRRKLGSRRTKAAKEPVKLATINRELAVMRRMMRHALAKGWMLRDIFFGSRVIVSSAETVRTRILSESEQDRLLAACEGERLVTYTRTHYGKPQTITTKLTVDNPHLKAMILLAVDSGLRRGEILKLTWPDIDLRRRVITVKASNTKTERERIVPLTARTKAELEKLRMFSTDDQPRPFPFVDFKHSWQTAKRIAGIDDLHFHDLRATAITRWQRDGLAQGLAAHIAGHSDIRTTQKFYTAADLDIVQDFGERMDRRHAEAKADTSAMEFVN